MPIPLVQQLAGCVVYLFESCEVLMRFTIRDLLWLTVVVAFAFLWLAERNERRRQADFSHQRLRELQALKGEYAAAHRQLVEIHKRSVAREQRKTGRIDPEGQRQSSGFCLGGRVGADFRFGPVESSFRPQHRLSSPVWPTPSTEI